ncbi:897_t:CDS:1, partial [Paraglomus occultum]
VPNPDVHPLILTSQADVARIRHPGETAIYRSNLALHGMALLSNPEKGVKTIAD